MSDLVQKYLVLIIYCVCSLAGLAHLLHDGERLPPTKVAGAIMMSGFAGVVVFLILFERLEGSPHLLAGISVLAGIGGASTLDFLLELAKRKLGGGER